MDRDGATPNSIPEVVLRPKATRHAPDDQECCLREGISDLVLSGSRVRTLNGVHLRFSMICLGLMQCHGRTSSIHCAIVGLLGVRAMQDNNVDSTTSYQGHPNPRKSCRRVSEGYDYLADLSSAKSIPYLLPLCECCLQWMMLVH